MIGDPQERMLAPTGRLRVAINLGNPILAWRGSSRVPEGISVDLARELARQRELEIDLYAVDTAAQSVAVVSSGEADLGFFAIDPARGAGIAFTKPYLLIEGWYLVRRDSPVADNAAVDQPGVRIAVGKGSAYDLFLSRTLERAQLERVPTSPGVVDHFLENGLEVAAGIRQQLEADQARRPGLRLLPERFMVIQQAMGVPVSRMGAAPLLNDFLRRIRESGALVGLLEKYGISGATIA
ncbi:ABC transporter substrate-binding protein [Bradyrhizobium sp. SK17]|nr:ABC transporter substrate-binding protein [Bradyrhizobium sp. SK17]